MRRALSEYVVTGIRTNLAFHEKLFTHPEFVAGRYDTGFIERYAADLRGPAPVDPAERDALMAAIAVTAARAETAASAPHGAAHGENAGALSPWVAQHRAGWRSGSG